MMQVIPCKQCGQTHIGFGKTHVEVNYKTSDYCEYCKNSEIKTISNFFCSVKCFEEFYIHDTQRAEPKPKLTPFEEWNTSV